MTTKLDKPLRREVRIGRDPWIVTITPEGLKLTRKKKRKGIELDWPSLVNGDAALAVALNASQRAARLPRERSSPARKVSRGGSRRARASPSSDGRA
jgi:hypothetical protein